MPRPMSEVWVIGTWASGLSAPEEEIRLYDE